MEMSDAFFKRTMINIAAGEILQNRRGATAALPPLLTSLIAEFHYRVTNYVAGIA